MSGHGVNRQHRGYYFQCGFKVAFSYSNYSRTNCSVDRMNILKNHVTGCKKNRGLETKKPGRQKKKKITCTRPYRILRGIAFYVDWKPFWRLQEGRSLLWQSCTFRRSHRYRPGVVDRQCPKVAHIVVHYATEPSRGKNSMKSVSAKSDSVVLGDPIAWGSKSTQLAPDRLYHNWRKNPIIDVPLSLRSVDPDPQTVRIATFVYTTYRPKWSVLVLVRPKQITTIFSSVMRCSPSWERTWSE